MPDGTRSDRTPHEPNSPERALHTHTAVTSGRLQRLNDPRRLETQLSEADLARVLALRGDEDLLDLGSGTGFYTNRIAALTSGLVYAVELQPEMNDHYRERGLPANVRLLLGDMTALPLAPAGAGAGDAAGVARPGAVRPGAEPATLSPHTIDVACTIATWHEIGGRLDVPTLVRVLRPGGRLVVIDWRKDPEVFENGPPLEERSSAAEVAASLASYFPEITTEDLGRVMFALTARLQPASGRSSSAAVAERGTAAERRAGRERGACR